MKSFPRCWLGQLLQFDALEQRTGTGRRPGFRQGTLDLLALDSQARALVIFRTRDGEQSKGFDFTLERRVEGVTGFQVRLDHDRLGLAGKQVEGLQQAGASGRVTPDQLERDRLG